MTPVAGFLVGEYLLFPLRERIRTKPGPLNWSDKALLFMIDPLGVLSAETDQLLGLKTTLQLQPIGIHHPVRTAWMSNAVPSQPELHRNLASAWGLQLRVDW